MSDNPICRGCKEDSGYDIKPIKHHYWARTDAYGIYTGIYCDECYDSNDSSRYPYKKDNYFDPAYAGERLDND